MCDVYSVDNQLRYAKTQLDRLKKTNVFNTTFHIWSVGPVDELLCVLRVANESLNHICLMVFVIIDSHPHIDSTKHHDCSGVGKCD